MPRTMPVTLRLGGVEVSVSLDRVLAERLKGSGLYRRLVGSPETHPIVRGEPALNGMSFEDIDWYQTIDLPGGVVTPGFVDHREQVDLYGLPESLEGKRCLDVATFDGFWAFEMERRGAAEVVGIDVHSLRDCDIPANFRKDYEQSVAGNVKGFGFAYAKAQLGSKARRRVLSVYELSPATIGTFDFVFLSDLLIHLRDPLRALEAVWSVTRGEAIIAEVMDPELESKGEERAMRFMLSLDEYSGCLWWYPTSSAWEAMLRLARFSEVEEVSRFDLATRPGGRLPKVVYRVRGGGAT